MERRGKFTREQAEELAIQALTFIASDAGRLGRFLAVTGIVPLRSVPPPVIGFLVGVLDYIPRMNSSSVPLRAKPVSIPLTSARDALLSAATTGSVRCHEFCRDCLADTDDRAMRCATCRSPRLLRHPEATSLSIAHVDCDAFYATIEKRDDPTLADKPVVVGGGKRGVVAAACYVARTYGIRSAMPMFEARQRCPDAVVVKPNMAKYVQVGREVRKAMFALTPLVEPLSIDEAFLDLTGTGNWPRHVPGKGVGAFCRSVEREFGITVLHRPIRQQIPRQGCVGPRQASRLRRAGASRRRRRSSPEKPVGFIYGVGAVSAAKLAADGFRTIADLQRAGRARSDATVWRGRRAAVASSPRARQSNRRSRTRHEKCFR